MNDYYERGKTEDVHRAAAIIIAFGCTLLLLHASTDVRVFTFIRTEAVKVVGVKFSVRCLL